MFLFSGQSLFQYSILTRRQAEAEETRRAMRQTRTTEKRILTACCGVISCCLSDVVVESTLCVDK